VSAVAVLRAASGGLIRRRVQTLVVFVVLVAASAAGILGLTLLTHANELFLNAVAEQRGADAAVFVNSGRVTDAQLAATGRLREVTRAAGPYPAAVISVEAGGMTFPGLTVVGRASRGGVLDDLALNAGRWPARPGQIALAHYVGVQASIGSTVTATSLPGKPRLTVVGYAGSVVRDEDAWVAPGEITALEKAGAAPLDEMLYDFTSAGSGPQITADISALKAVLPAGAVYGYVSWLSSADQTGSEQGINTPFVVAFAIMALVLSVLIVASVVSGAVLAGYRRIGVLKSIGFTPVQVACAYLAQVGVPTLAGCAAGAIAGNYWVAPLLGTSAGAFRVGRQGVPLWINVAVPLGLCALVGLAALPPALRAGRMSAVAAVTTGQAPRPGGGYAVHRLLGRLRLPRPVTIGLAAPLARPARSAATGAAILFGVTAVVLAVGVDSSLAKTASVASPNQSQVQVVPGRSQFVTPPGAAFTTSQDREIRAALDAQAGTLRYVAETLLGPGQQPTVDVPGLQPSSSWADFATSVSVTAYDGDSAWLGWPMVSGSWYHQPGQVDVDAAFLTATGLSVGDTIPMTVNGRATTVRIVGEVFALAPPLLLTSWQTLGGAAAGLTADQYDIGLRPGASPAAYVAALNRALGPGYGVFGPQSGGSAAGLFGLADLSLIRLLTLMLAVLAGLGVLNSLLMAARERVYDLGVFKAVGMSPRQTIAMVACWVVVPGLAAGVIGIPAAIVAHYFTMQGIGSVEGTGMTASLINVYRPAELVLLALAGLAIAAVGALLPASWAARSRTTVALRAE
jgi:putative ABC transport system permease protein